MVNRSSDTLKLKPNTIKPYKAITQTVWANIAFTLDFQEFISWFESELANIQDWKNSSSELPKPSQKVFPNWKNELYNIWNEFPRDEAEKIIRALHARKKLWKNKEWKWIYINYNSYDFFRDTNISISIVDEVTGKEVCLLWVFIWPDKTIELFQIQGKRKNWFEIEDYDELYEYLESLLQSLWFKRIVTLKSSKNYFSERPFITKGSPGSHEEKLFLKKHRSRMWMTYDIWNLLELFCFHRFLMFCTLSHI